jgi:hypothetical protein
MDWSPDPESVGDLANALGGVLDAVLHPVVQADPGLGELKSFFPSI